MSAMPGPSERRTDLIPEPSQRKTRRWGLEVCAAGGVLAWRIILLSPRLLWRDWISILCVYWVFTVFTGHTRSWKWGTLAVMGVLLILYLLRQLPLMVDAMRFAW